MAELAQAAVFARTTLSESNTDSDVHEEVQHHSADTHHTNDTHEIQRDSAQSTLAHKVVVCGPAGAFDSVPSVLSHYAHMGFQASNYGQAVRVARDMLRRQPPSRSYVVQGDAFVEVTDDTNSNSNDEDMWVYPTLFMGITANLLGTGCREAVRFLVKHGIQPREKAMTTSDKDAARLHESHLDDLAAQDKEEEDWAACDDSEEFASMPPYKSFITALVVSGGGIEHDIRRACSDYVLDRYASDAAAAALQKAEESHSNAHDNMARFGNICYEDNNNNKRLATDAPQSVSLFDEIMQAFVMRLCARQERRKARAMTSAALPTGAADSLCEVCSWAITPSEVWYCAGRWLVSLLMTALTRRNCAESRPRDALYAEAVQRAQGTVVYWAARQRVPIFSPSFVDGDIMRYILPRHNNGVTMKSELPHCPLQLDLVGDIHALNKCAMLSKCSAMLIAGGGVVKHHVCNANLMRNGADYAIFINNGMEFDGSDAGARPDEAVSWGKIRIDGHSVKIYSEVTVVLPLLVAEVFLPAVRECMELQPRE